MSTDVLYRSTPPHHSPASDSSASVRPSRSYFSPSTSPPRSPHGGRPVLPRSASSTQHHHRQRSSPKFSPTFADHAEDVSHPPNTITSPTAMLRPPSPRLAQPNNLVSPPDSAQNSSDDESNGKPVTSLEQLHEAVRRLEINRHSSPTGEQPSQLDGAASNPQDHEQQGSRPRTPPGHLSSTARKISHSRSSTETSILNPPMTPQAEDEDQDETEEDFLGPKPPLIRKKSGELVKPAIRPRTRRKHSSMPGTPTYSKAVHFNDDIEQVRHFLQAEKPLAVSAGTSPVDTYDSESEFPWLGSTRNGPELQMKSVNFPRESLERQSLPIRVEKLWLAADKKNLMGAVAVANLAFQKHVAARFTFDHWRTTSEVVAEFNANPSLPKREDGYDNFQFSVKLTDQGSIETKSLLLCMRYYVNGQEYWDNNDGNNYLVEFTKVEKPAPVSRKAPAGLGARPIPRSRHNSPAGRRPRSMPSFEDDFSSGFDGGPNFKFRNFSTESKPPTLPDTPPPPKVKQSGQGQQFGSRYDFGASLTAALSQAQGQMGGGSPITEVPPVPTSESESTPGLTRHTLSRSGTDSPRPEALLANHQTRDSRAYQEFVSKFCFFNGKGTKAPNTSPVAGQIEEQQQSQQRQQQEQQQQQVAVELPKQAKEFKFPAKAVGSDGAQDQSDFPSGPIHITDSKGQSMHFENRPSRQRDAQSVAPAERDMRMRSQSPMSFGYPYSGHGGFFSGSATPPAIRS